MVEDIMHGFSPGDAYPNASNYIDVLIRNGGFYRITLKDLIVLQRRQFAI